MRVEAEGRLICEYHTSAVLCCIPDGQQGVGNRWFNDSHGKDSVCAGVYCDDTAVCYRCAM